jgi:hypothetical protein
MKLLKSLLPLPLILAVSAVPALAQQKSQIETLYLPPIKGQCPVEQLVTNRDNAVGLSARLVKYKGAVVCRVRVLAPSHSQVIPQA